MATFDEFYASLDPDVGVRGKQFEKFIKWFLKTDPTWSSQIDEVWLWNDYPRRWGADCGIDLVFTHKNGKTWAVQSKCVAPNNDIKKSEIDSFLSESSDSKIDGRLLIASTDGIGKNAQQVINRQEKQVVCFLLEQFRQSEIEFPSSMDDLNQGKRKEKKKPRPHQIEAIEKVSEGIKTADRGQVLMACGTGKTLTSLWIKEKINAEQVLVLVPSLSLLSQILKEWNAEANESFKWICVCSDQSVAKDKSEDEWISNTSEIGVPVTSETLEIKNFLDESGSKVVFSTYQSAPLIVEAQEHHDTSPFDLVIADEAHRCAGKVSDAFGCVLDENKIKSQKRLFLTATPRVLSKQLKKSASKKEIEVASMDDHSVFGEVLYQIKFSEAIKKDLLSDYQVVVVGVDDQMIRDQIENRDLVEIGNNELKTDAETLASHIALAKATNEYNLQRVITFHGLVKGAKYFAEDHKKVNKWMHSAGQSTQVICSEHVSGEMSSSERNKRINRLKNLSKGERIILTNARCLSEGVDVPNLDGIAFIDPKQSQIDIIQAVGRAIRKSENKTFGTIVIPVYLSQIYENINDQVLASKFSSVWKIILALKSQDDSLMEEIDSLRINLGKAATRGTISKGIRKIIIDLPKKVSVHFINKLQTILIQNTSDDWLEKFGELKNYKEQNNNMDPPTYHSSLGQWTSTQKVEFKRHQLKRERINLLNSIGFVWDPYEEAWRSKFEELKEYKKNNGHLNPPKKEYPSLIKWAKTQRTNLNQGILNKDRENLLNSIGFIWDIKEEEWQRKFEELKEYKKKNGHVNPPRRTGALGSWVGTQRYTFQQKELSYPRIQLLESIGFIWDIKEEEWQSKFEELKEYKKKNGHLNPPVRFGSLGGWVTTQRRIFKEKSMPKDRVKLLNSIGFIWDIKEEEWQRKFEELKEYKKKNGHVNPPKSFGALGVWVLNQRREKSISKDRKDLLDGIGFVWNPYEEEWQSKFDELKEYKKKNGHVNPSANSGPLGSWVSTQRLSFSKNKMSKEKSDLLESIGFSWDRLEEQWQSKFDEFKEYKNKNGDKKPPKNSSLGRWSQNQRTAYKNKKISKKRIEMLESLKGWIWSYKN
ncbi:DEAD/DEAH box helicase [Prochlorococcus sp. MIT 0604]|uniref:DEAD/DEAH box helicase n=1 Tax=Prochlorococcus sp. MIT 0604 TaxID=1501268 RepID=UPI0004F682F2|nr:DEAD/DEAH box helicase [Prochlorococcus sp. MIT 0604]AIQ94074.1 hypothetical protein EW14_0046 [Prochlorococcus sp. MIT 0604]